MAYRILDVHWYTPQRTDICIGVVAIESDPPDGGWKCYIGYGDGKDEQADAQNIAAHGSPLHNPEAAGGFFPFLDLKNYQL